MSVPRSQIHNKTHVGLGVFVHIRKTFTTRDILAQPIAVGTDLRRFSSVTNLIKVKINNKAIADFLGVASIYIYTFIRIICVCVFVHCSLVFYPRASAWLHTIRQHQCQTNWEWRWSRQLRWTSATNTKFAVIEMDRYTFDTKRFFLFFSGLLLLAAVH